MLEPWVTLFNKTDKVLYSFYIHLFLFLSLFFVLLLHTTFNPSIRGVSGVILLTPAERLVSSEVLPILEEGNNLLHVCVRDTKSFKFSHLLFQIISWFKSPLLFCFYVLKNLSVHLEKASRLICEAIVTFGSEIRPNIETETVLLEILFRHFVLVKEDPLPIAIIKGPFVGICKHVICLLDLHKYLFRILRRVLIWVVFES